MKTRVLSTSMYFILAVLLFALISACTLQKNTATPTPELQQLRITNRGSSDITGLVVLFPGTNSVAEASRVEFGNLTAGQTSTYRSVPSGVYAYAAYNYRIGDREVTQAVTDWVGESPLAGKKFTYQLALDLQKIDGDQMQLIDVLVDEP